MSEVIGIVPGDDYVAPLMSLDAIGIFYRPGIVETIRAELDCPNHPADYGPCVECESTAERVRDALMEAFGWVKQ